MNVFEAVKQSVTTRQAAEHYGIRVNRNGMACCPFHNDKTPSMKLDKRFHCFGCGADGDVIDFVAALYGLGEKRKPPHSWRVTSGLPMRTGSHRAGQGSPSPGRNPRKNSSGKQRHIASVSLPIIYTSYGYGKPTMTPHSPDGSVSSPVRGSLAEASPCGISAGCAAVRGDRGKRRF